MMNDWSEQYRHLKSLSLQSRNGRGVADGTSIVCHPTRKCTGKEEGGKKE